MLNTSHPSISHEGRKSLFCSFILFRLYGMTRTNVLRTLMRRLVLRLEGGPMYSVTARAIFRQYHGVDVGMYTLGPCEENPGRFPPGTTIGRYSSIYWTARVVSDSEHDGNEREESARFKLDIGHDVFVGHNVIILSSARRIGDGAFIGAGSVVQQPVPPYGVVMGNPARVVKYRFSKKTISELLESKWWDKSLDELRPQWKSFEGPLERDDTVASAT